MFTELIITVRAVSTSRALVQYAVLTNIIMAADWYSELVYMCFIANTLLKRVQVLE